MDIAGFYDGDERRRESEEVIYGDDWTTSKDAAALYKAAWVEETGELYVVREPQHGGIIARYLDQLHVDAPDTDEMTVEILMTGTQNEIDAALAGWQDRVVEDDSLDWLKSRTAS